MGSVVKAGTDGLFGFLGASNRNAAYDAQKTIGMAQIDSQNLLAESKAASENALRGSNNTLMAAQVALSGVQRSIANSQKLDVAGKAVNASVINMARMSDKFTQGSLERQLQSAEQLGAVHAAAAASGVGGTTGRMLQATLAATSARRESQIQDSQQQTTFDALLQRSGLMSGAIRALDEGQVFAPMDFTKSIASKTVAPLWQADYQPSAITQGVLSMGTDALGAALGGIGGAVSSLLSGFGSASSTSAGLFGLGAGTPLASASYGSGFTGSSGFGSAYKFTL